MKIATLSLALTLLSSSVLSWGNSRIDIDFYQHDPRPYTHELPLNLVLFDKGPWTQHHVKENLQEAAKIYAQCGVKLRVNTISRDPREGYIYFDLEGYTSENEPRDKDSALSYGKKYSSPNNLTVYFIDSFDSFYNNIRATAVPQERIQYEDQKDVLNTVWISYETQVLRNLTRVEGGFQHGYSDLAHELGHILFDASHVEGNHIHNLMHESFNNLNGHLTLGQCKEIKTSPQLRKLSIPRDQVCPEITSPLRGAINFVTGVRTDCQKVSDIIDTLEKTIDEVSDLATVGGIDFILEKESDLIVYSDRNYFEASLNITFDELGMHPLRKEQSDILWMHELGHALFNAKLEEDWPWFKGRLAIMKEWGRLIRNSFDPNIDDMSNSSLINEQISLLENYPNSFIIDDMIAPYHELFADAIVVIHTKDPQIIKKGLAHPSAPDSQADRERDFSIHHSSDNWAETEAHSLLSPVRSHLWKLISELQPHARTKQEITRRLYDVLKEDLLERSQHPHLWSISVQDINKRLIRKLTTL